VLVKAALSLPQRGESNFYFVEAADPETAVARIIERHGIVASPADFGKNTPETTPPSIPTNPATGPRRSK
jgi:hypothetical protein